MATKSARMSIENLWQSLCQKKYFVASSVCSKDRENVIWKVVHTALNETI